MLRRVDQTRSPRWGILYTLASFSLGGGASHDCFPSLWLWGESQLRSLLGPLSTWWGMALLIWFHSLLLQLLLSRSGSLPPALSLRMDSCKSFTEKSFPEPSAESKSVSGHDSLFPACRSRSPTSLPLGRALLLCQHVENPTFPVVLGGPEGVFQKELDQGANEWATDFCQSPSFPVSHSGPVSWKKTKELQHEGKSLGMGGRLWAGPARAVSSPWFLLA